MIPPTSRSSRVKLAAVTIALLTATSARFANATVVCCQLHHAGHTAYVEHCSNHGYYPRSADYELRHQAQAVRVLRWRMVIRHLIRRLPIVVTVPYRLDKPRIAWQANCTVAPGECDDWESRSLGDCYRIELPEGADYQSLRALVVALQLLKGPGSERTVEHPLALGKRLGAELPPFANLRFVADSWLSPTKAVGLNAVWHDGKLRFAQTNSKGRSRRWLSSIAGYLAFRPVWSVDGRQLAYGSLAQVRWHDLAAKKSASLAVSQLLPASGVSQTELFAAFDSAAEHLWSSPTPR